MHFLDVLFIECICTCVFNCLPYRSRFLLRETCKQFKTPRTANEIVEQSYMYFLERRDLKLTNRWGKMVLQYNIRDDNQYFNEWFYDQFFNYLRYVSKNLKSIVAPNDLDKYTISISGHIFVLCKETKADDDSYSHLPDRYKTNSFGGSIYTIQKFTYSLRLCTELTSSYINESYPFEQRIPGSARYKKKFHRLNLDFIEIPELIIAS